MQSLSNVDLLFGEKRRRRFQLPEHLAYFESITIDDADDVDLCLTMADEDLHDPLLNGRFEFCDVMTSSNPNAKQCSVTHPLILAIVYGSV